VQRNPAPPTEYNIENQQEDAEIGYSTFLVSKEWRGGKIEKQLSTMIVQNVT